MPLINPSMSAIGAGAASIFHASAGCRGTISAASSTSSFTLSSLVTAGGQAVGINQLANRGDGVGYQIKVVDNASGASGKTESATIVSNTGGATPVVTVSPALTFTPTATSVYEIQSGRVFFLGAGAIGASSWKYYDFATNAIGALSQTNLAATIQTDSQLFAFSELYVSNDRSPGDGFIDTNTTYNNGNSKCCVATASGGTSITSAALANPSTPSLFTNEYRNFQVRIVEDTGTPTSVGQRRNITSHTSGNTPVFTVPVWSVTPSTTAKFVIEQNDDRIAARTSGSTNMYSYSISGNAWDAATTWTAGGGAPAAGVMIAPCFGITRDPLGNRLQGQFWIFRGGVSPTVDMWDITAGSTGVWSLAVVFGFSTQTFDTGDAGCYDPIGPAQGTNKGRIFHFSLKATNINLRFDVMTGTLLPGPYLGYPTISALVGQRSFMVYTFDGTTVVPSFYIAISNSSYMFSFVVAF